MNSRQISILKDLENAVYPITGNTLAKDYNVSLRTIRADIKEIEYFLKDKEGVVFEKKPKSGMRILSNSSVYDDLINKRSSNDFISMNEQERNVLMLLAFILGKQPITLNQLSNSFDISKGAVISEIQNEKKWLEKEDITLKGVKNKGYFLEGSIFNIVSFANKALSEVDYSLFNVILFSGENSFFTNDDFVIIEKLTRFLEEDLLCLFMNRLVISVWLGWIIKNASKEKGKIESYGAVGSKLQQIEQFFSENLHLYPSKEQLSVLQYVLSNNSYFEENNNEGNKILTRIVENIILGVSKTYPEVMKDYDNLESDLIRHIIDLLNRKKLNIENDNPLLTNIINNYYGVFEATKSAMKEFEDIYKLQLSDDEIGFITLYFCRSIDKYTVLNDARVLVVCSTGKGAAKLLATRLMNNFPNIHIVGICFAQEVEYRVDLLSMVDLVVSTVNLNNISKPCCVVSPFLTEIELLKISESIWISKHETKGAPDKISNDISTLNDNKLQSRLSRQDYNAQLYAEINVMAIEMLVNLFPEGINKTNYSLNSGLLAHITLSIPRWCRGEFEKCNDFDEMKNNHLEQYTIVQDFIKKVSELIGVYIDPCEIIGIMRYLV